MEDQENSKKTPNDNGLPDFKKNCLLADNRLLPLQPLPFSDFQVWVLERWKYASENEIFGPKDHLNSSDVEEEDLEAFLQQKVMLIIHFK